MKQKFGSEFNSPSPPHPVYRFESALQNIEASGHQFLLEFEDIFIRVMFALQGQVVVGDDDFFAAISADSYSLKDVKWPLAITLEQQNKVLLFVDHNKMAQFVVMLKDRKWNNRNCNPVTDWQKYRETIVRQFPSLRKRFGSIFDLICNSKLFNGFGAHHTTEALHFARIHPMTPADHVFKVGKLREDLLDGLHRFAHLVTTRSWKRHISASCSLRDPFYFSKHSWDYYRSRINKVYKKQWVIFSRKQYLEMEQAGLMHIDGVPVHERPTRKREKGRKSLRLPIWRVWLEMAARGNGRRSWVVR